MERLLLDDLTGAYQRAGLTDLLSRLAEERAGGGAHHALAMLDVDHLKTLNDVYGHATGDAALKAVAQRASRVLRPVDRLFRYGGDEFLLVLPGTRLAEAEAVLKRVMSEVIANPVEAAVWVSVNISVGVAATDEAGAAPGAALFERADARLYAAKRAGRNVVVASDVAPAPAEGGLLRETRLVGRDAALAVTDAFLAEGTSEAAGRVLQVRGPAAVGFTRFLAEVGVRGGIAGRIVRRVDAAPAHQGVYLRCLERAYAERLPLDPTESEVARLLADEAEGRGLLVLLEGGGWLDAGSRRLLGERLRRGGAKLVEAVPEGQLAAFHPGRTVDLAALSVAETSSWLAAALGSPVDPRTVEALVRAGGGRPGRMARTVLALGAARFGGAETPTGAELAAASRAGEGPSPELLPDLPRWDGPLVGRSRWLAGASPLVRGSRLNVLVGPGGVGKSRLAAQLALELAEELGGAVHWIDLRAVRDAEAVPRLISGRLGLEEVGGFDELAERLAGDPRLLVLDELDGMADQSGWVESLLDEAPGLRLLVTCRMPLRLAQERVIEVPELSPASAGELFRRGMERVGAEGAPEEEELSALIEQVGPNPLAVELAAAWTRGLSLAELQQELARRPDLTTAAADLQPRTARFIDITRELMSEAEQEALGTLALVPAGFTAQAGRRAANASPFFLLALLERSLIRREGERYTVHAAIAERYRAGLKERAAAEERVARTYAELAARVTEMTGYEQSNRGYRLLDAERPNLAYALELAAGRRDAPTVWPLVKALRGYLDVRGLAREGLELFRVVEQAFAGSDEPELRGWVAETMALFHAQREEFQSAEQRIEEALRLLKGRAPAKTAALAWNTLGIVHGLQGRSEEALAAFVTSAEMREQAGDDIGEAQARGNVAIVLTELGRAEEAFEALQQATESYRRVEHASGVALSLVNLVRLGRNHGLLSPGEQLDHAREAQEMAEAMGYASGARVAAEELGRSLLLNDRPTEAQAAFERARGWAQREGNAQAESAMEELVEAARQAAADRLRRQVESV